MLGGWDLDKSDFDQPLNQGPIYERINGKWVEKCPMEANFKAADIVFLEAVSGRCDNY